MKRKNLLSLIVLSLFLLGLSATVLLTPINFIFAQADPYGTTDLGIQLDPEIEPRRAVVNIINIALSFLGLIAVIIVIYGGFVWMTSGGEAEKVNKAKKILKNGLIGLAIILLSWGIVTWVISQLAGGLSGDISETCNPGDFRQCYVCQQDGLACYGTETCLASGFWGACVNHSCNCDSPTNGNGNGQGALCDAQPSLTGCFPDHDLCDPGYYCSAHNCTCQPQGGLGDPCSSDETVCVVDHDLCNSNLNLTCSQECVCQGNPIITEISPVGGFCENNINQACLSDDDCGDDICNLDRPNGAPNNFITILGHNFGQAGENSQVVFNSLAGNDIAGLMPNNLNANCVNTWDNNQIVIAVPEGAGNGPITVVANSGRSGSTDDGIGPIIPDFIANNISRPGLCLIDPDSGALGEKINYQGINLFNADAYFGNYQQNIKGINSSFDSAGFHGEAQTPNVSPGKMSTFAQGTISGVLLFSNYLDFFKQSEAEPGPYINSFSPNKGRAGQYVTIYGGGFGNNQGGNKVFFADIEADYNFPPVCLHSVWENNRVIVKVPEEISDGSYIIKMEIGGEEITTANLNPNSFTVDSGLALAPNLCKISPVRGQAETEVTLWGEYFGGADASVSAVFHVNELVASQVKKDGSTDYFNVLVASGAITGPVKVRDSGGLEGNSLNFEIGPCQTDADCGTQICCPVDTYMANRCADSLADCAIDIPSSVFEWSFDTEFDKEETEDHCGLLENLEDCQTDDDCCYNFKDNECQSMSLNNLNIIEEGDDLGYCAFYSCDTEDPSICDSTPNKDGQYSDFDVCQSQCSDDPIGLGLSCFNRQSKNCDPYNICSYPFNCFTEEGLIGDDPLIDCGICCCQVDDQDSCDFPDTDLVCQPNQSPCTGDKRGLCCGCSQDIDCGDPAETLGCGYDTCCRARPGVIKEEMVPGPGEDNVCRNAIIEVPFNQRMELASLAPNIMLLEEREYDDGPCPTGTFALEDNIKKNQNLFSRTWASLVNFWASIFPGISSDTVLAGPSEDKLYCLIPGSSQVKQEADRSVLRYIPLNLLKDGTVYYLIIKGDEDLNSQSGVLSLWGVGMNGAGLNGDDTVEFNLVAYPNSFISSFKTLPDQGIANTGVCIIDYVSISPSSYLFNTTDNDLNELDHNSRHSTFDTKRDKDKVFHVSAHSFDGQIITPTPGYAWDWNWNWEQDILEEKSTSPELPDKQIFLKVKSTVTDASTILEATVDMSNYDNNFTDDGEGIKGQANITVFVCRNPWPAINPSTHHWEPWKDSTYNYQFYYCRDDGSSALADDLPAIIHPAITVGPSQQLICSTTNLPCTNEEAEGGVGSRCGPGNQGFCVWSVLRESYFFRQVRPSGGKIDSAEDLQTGGEILLKWTGQANLIYHINPALRGHYRLYYAKTGSDFSYLEISLDNCDLTEAEYSCQYQLTGLEDNQEYVFRVSAVTRTKVETFFSNQERATPTDQTAPDAPSGCSGQVIGKNENMIEFTCSDVAAEAEFLRLYHGVIPGSYGQLFEGEFDQENSFSVDLYQFNYGDNYFVFSVVDQAGNESEKSAEITINVPPAIPGACGYQINIDEENIRFGCNNIDAHTYRLALYYGSEMGNYDFQKLGLDNNNYIIIDFSEITEATGDKQNYFVVTALDTSGNESAYSSEMMVNLP